MSLEAICKLYGVARQGYYFQKKAVNTTAVSTMLILALVKELKKDIPNMGGRKLFHVLQPELHKHNMQIGRDHLFDLLRFHGLLVKRRKRRIKTTDSFHRFRKYPNLLEGYTIYGAEQLLMFIPDHSIFSGSKN